MFIVRHIYSAVESEHATFTEAVSKALEWGNGIVFDEADTPLWVAVKGRRFVPADSDEAKPARLLSVLKHISKTNVYTFGGAQGAVEAIMRLAARAVEMEDVAP